MTLIQFDRGDGFSRSLPNGNILANLRVLCCCLSAHWRVRYSSVKTQISDRFVPKKKKNHLSQDNNKITRKQSRRTYERLNWGIHM